MTEQEFKTNYVKSYLAAYQSAVTAKSVQVVSSVNTPDKLLAVAKKNAERAWQQYLKENSDSK